MLADGSCGDPPLPGPLLHSEEERGLVVMSMRPLHWRAVCLTASLLEATCRRALNFLLALSSNRRDAQNGQIKSGPITGSGDVSKSKNGCRSSATPGSQPRSPGPQAQGTAPALHDGCKFSACDFGCRADAGVRPTGGAFAPAGLEHTISGGRVRTAPRSGHYVRKGFDPARLSSIIVI